jgi:hypothetical protein
LIEHVVCNSVGKVGADLGQIRADLDYGLKSKVAAHMKLYVFYYGTQVIGATDQEIIVCQDDNANTLTEIIETRIRRSKPDQT